MNDRIQVHAAQAGRSMVIVPTLPSQLIFRLLPQMILPEQNEPSYNTNILDISTKLTPLCLPSCSLSHESNSISLAPLLAELAHLHVIYAPAGLHI